MEDFEKHLAMLHQEFLDSSGDGLLRLDTMLEGAAERGEILESEMVDLARIVHSLKGSGGTFGFTNLTIIAHRFEDYIAASESGIPIKIEDMQHFVDLLGDVLDGRISNDGPIDAIVRSLPMRSRFDVSDVTVTDVEVGLIMDPGAQARLVTKELEAVGYRVTGIQSSLQGFSYIYQTKPDCVFVSANMPGMDGVDLICAIKAMKATKDIPCVLLTSFNRDNQLLQALPETVPIVRKGQYFADDLADALQKLKMI